MSNALARRAQQVKKSRFPWAKTKNSFELGYLTMYHNIYSLHLYSYTYSCLCRISYTYVLPRCINHTYQFNFEAKLRRQKGDGTNYAYCKVGIITTCSSACATVSVSRSVHMVPIL